MQPAWTRRFTGILSIVAGLAASGCASEREPINRVQSDALAKDFFVGDLADPKDDPEFYWRNFVVDASEAQSMVGIGSWSGVDRIRWEITENTLIARRAYQTNPGGDDKGLPGKHPDGDIVAAYPIDKHFDIQRAYNSSTGEELNVIDENTSDRTWNERDYFRVNWAINLVNSPLWLDMFLGKLFGDIDVTPVSYFVNDPTHPDAPRFELEEGYFDITNKFVVKPQSVAIGGGQRLPLCVFMGMYTGSAVESCAPQEAVVRSSYWRVDEVDPDGDFEPFENSRAALDIVGNPGGIGDSYTRGIVTPPRIDYDPQYGYTDANLRAFMHVHNIWEQSHQTKGKCTSDGDCKIGQCLPSGTCSVTCSYDASGDSDGNGTDDQCENSYTGYEDSLGSQCSMRDRCTIPYRDRKVKPIAFWMNKETPLELTDKTDAEGNFVSRGPTEDLGYTWNQSLRHAVARARETECRRTGDGDRRECHFRYFEEGTEMVSFGGWGMAKVKPMEDVLVICHNPVRIYDPELCGETGYSARVGDLRHNFLFYWPHSSQAPWGGIANWNADPLTGQIIGASATTMGQAATRSAAITRDIIMVANGELEMEDITRGTPASLYQKRLQNGHAPKALTEEQIQSRIASVDAEHAVKQLAPKVDGDPQEALMRQLEMKQNTFAAKGTPTHLETDALLEKLRGSVFEAQVVDPHWVVDSLAMQASGGVSDDLLGAASPLRGQDLGGMQNLFHQIHERIEAHGVCYMRPYIGEVGNFDVRGVARYFLQKYNDGAVERILIGEGIEAPSAQAVSRRRAELIYTDLWKESYKGIQLHEMGHALGMLHQFASSYDSTNYNPQYWQLRTQEGQAQASCHGDPRSGRTDTCMGPRYLDPETDDELGQGAESRPGINYFAHTSTMEYQNERFFESVGLGQYDLFTMNVLYGRVVETFDPAAGMDQEAQLQFGMRNYSQLLDEHYVLTTDEGSPSIETIHYTEAARRMKLYDESRCRTATDEEKARAEWRIVHGKVCAPPAKDYGHWDDFENGSAVGIEGILNTPKSNVRGDAGAAAGNIRWPYRYGTSNNSYPHTNPSDAGADIYELARETIKKFEYVYPFRYFRRQSREWAYPFIPSRTVSSFYERLRSYHWGIAIGNAFRASRGEDAFNEAANSDDDWRPFLMAETEMFEAIARSLLMPQIGSYDLGSDGQMLRAGSGNFFKVDASTGRYISPSFDNSATGGGSWEYQDWINWLGFSIEKSEAGKALTDGRPAFFTTSAENYLDGRNISINFRTDMPEAVDRLIGGLLASDWETIAPYVRQSEINIGNDRTPPVHIMDLSSSDASPSRPEDARLLFPNLGYRQQISTLMWAHVFSRLNTDLTLSNKLRIWIDGHKTEFNIPESQKVRFYNPESGLTYIARRWGPDEIDGKVVDKGIGSRMLQRAMDLLLQAYAVERGPDGEVLYDVEGLPTILLDANSQPVEVEGGRLEAYRDYVGILDAAVQIGELVGYGPFNGVPDF